MMDSKMKLPSLRNRTSSNLVKSDVAALIQSFGESAYDEARPRAREERLGKAIDGNRPRGHWDRVRQEIAKRTGRQTGLDAATRYLES